MPPYPPPLSIPPLHGPSHHTHTLILLHGRGSNAAKFSSALLSSTNLATRLPTVKFLFPTARKRRASAFNRAAINQWFDIHSLLDPGERAELQIEGLAQTAAFLRELVAREAGLLGGGEEGYARVIVGGLSQGCAAGVLALLGGLAGGARVGAFVGLSGWLPLRGELEGILGRERDTCSSYVGSAAESLEGVCSEGGAEGDSSSDESSSSEDEEAEEGGDGRKGKIRWLNCMDVGSDEDLLDFDPFENMSIDGCSRYGRDTILDRQIQALNHVRDVLDLPPLEDSERGSGPPQLLTSYLEIPVFIGHGTADAKVSVHHGEDMVNTLATELDMDVTWKPYVGFGHWYKIPEEIDDILDFLKAKIDVPVEAAVST